MRVIAVFNHKGGVGKTTTVANLGAGLARRGRKVLLVDVDPQACLTVHFGIDPETAEKTIYDVLCRDMPFGDAVREIEGPSLLGVPSHLDLAGAELELATTMGRERILRDALERYLGGPQKGSTHSSANEPPSVGIDYVLFDCPPSLGLLTVNALTAADEVFVPLQTEFLALRGVGKLVEVVTLVRRRLNPALQITGILPTLARTGTLLAREVQEEIARHFGSKVFKTKIRSNVKLAEAPSHGQSIFAYAPGSAGAEDYAALAGEVDVMDVPRRAVAPAEPEIRVDDILARVEPRAN